jgi:anti-anti-sigma regulatory factor
MAEAMPESTPFTGAETYPDLEVATLSADTLRASIRVTGTLVPNTASLVTSILRTHVAAGRRYLRVDLAGAHFTDDGVVAALVSAHRTISDLGGMLVFENAGPRMVDAIRSATLFANSRD